MAAKKSSSGAEGSPASFVHLRVHSSYSLSEGAIQIAALADLCKDARMPAMAITDSGNLFGSLEFSVACAKGGIQPIIGCEVRVKEVTTQPNGKPETSTLVLLAKDQEGYQNLLSLVSDAFLSGQDSHHPAVTFDAIAAHSAGLVALTGGAEGVLGTLLQKGQSSAVEKRCDTLQKLFGDRLYIEIARHGIEAEAQTEPGLLELAYGRDIPLVATNNVYFATREMFDAHDALICIADGRYISEDNRRRFTSEHYFKTAEEMAALFADLPEAISNTRVIAERCAVMAELRDPILPDFPTQKGQSQEEELLAVAEAGLEARLAAQGVDVKKDKEATAPYFERLEFELGVITRMHYAGYFLIVSDFIRWAKEQSIPVGPGRGSGSGSVVAWALRITDLDPLRFGLLFERFLNPERVSMPDFDIDFCQERRDEVIRYVQQKYGADKVAQIITFGKLQARAVLRDVGRVVQMPYGQVDRICKMIPFNPIEPVTLSRAIEMDPDLQKERDADEEVARLLDMGLKLEGLHRHASTHAAGVVIADRPLRELVPLYYDPRSDFPVTQYAMKHAEMAGLVKFDFLGLKTLTVIARSVALIEEQGEVVDIECIPFDNVATYQMLSEGDTTGVFQMESAGMRDALRKMKPDSIEDIIALISLYRPGPMENIPTYIARKHGKEKPDYLHPLLEEVLEETYGVIIYQEQVMEIAKVLAGYSLGAADLLRKAMGKKIKAEMDAQREIFVSGAVKNKVDKAQASSIFDLVAKFAGYGFNKAHAAAYAVIGYQTAYLKANYPVEFFTASMNIDSGDTDKIAVFRQEAQRAGIVLLPPDINASCAWFATEAMENPKEGERKRAIRYALGALKNVGMAAMEALEEERAANGPFTDIFDMAGRCDSKVINKRQIENLAKAGTFDSIHPNRRQVFEAANLLVRHSACRQEEKSSQQENLFGGFEETALPQPVLPEVVDWSEDERMQLEYEAVGFYLTAHPLAVYMEALPQLGVVTASTLEEQARKFTKEMKLAGVVTHITHRASENKRFAYVQFSDPSGTVEVSIFDEELITQKRDLLESQKPLLITVEARKDEGGVRLNARVVEGLDDFMARQRGVLRITLAHTQNLQALKATLAEGQTGQTVVELVTPTEKGDAVVVRLPESRAFSVQLPVAVEALDGVAAVQYG